MILFRIGMSQRTDNICDKVHPGVPILSLLFCEMVRFHGVGGGGCVFFDGSSMNDMLCGERGYVKFYSQKSKAASQYICQIIGDHSKAAVSLPFPLSPLPLPLHFSSLPSPFLLAFLFLKVGSSYPSWPQTQEPPASGS